MHPIEQRLQESPWPNLVVLSVAFAGFVYLLSARGRLPALRASWPEAVLRASIRPWIWLDLAVVVGVMYYAGLIAGWWLKRHDVAAGSFPMLALGGFCTHALPLLLVGGRLLLTRVSVRRAFGAGRDRLPRDLLTGARAFLAFTPFMLAANVLSGTVLTLLGKEPQFQQVVLSIGESEGFGQRLFLALWAVLLAPVAEEVLFRGMLLPMLLKLMRPWAAILLVSLFFGAIHEHLAAFLPLSFFSIALSAAYLTSGSLVVPVVMHLCFNALSMLVVMAVG